ncbi:hypothetical protein GCM10028867_38490 [Nocardioides pacificus]
MVAGHESVVRPTRESFVVLRTGPVLPDARIPSGAPIGVDVTLGKTQSESTGELISRYAFIASQPEGQIAKVEDTLVDMAELALLRGAAMGALPVGLWLLLGADRRRGLLRRAATPTGVAVVAGSLVALTLSWQPWEKHDETFESDARWVGLQEFLGEAVPLPPEATDVQIRADVTTQQTRRLLESAVSTFDKSKSFYAEAAETAETLELREPAEDETVAILVTDRHDNIGMDPVARAIADNAGATVILDAGDDTSTGKPWEAFSLDSLDEAFDDLDRFGVTGNHDSGDFVGDYLAERGWNMLGGEVVEGPGGSPLIGVPDPRSSGLGAWRDETGLTFAEVEEKLTEEVCAAEERVATVLVHDANLASDVLDAGCADLVIGGHTHVRSGPELVLGPEGERGYTYTNGTTGGAAYAIAVGSKPRRPAEVSLITYRDGRPVGIQAVLLQTNGRFDVADFVELTFTEPAVEAAPAR